MSKTLLLTGASGFVGSTALRRVMSHTDWNVVAVATMTHGGLPERLDPLIEQYHRRIQVVRQDLSSARGLNLPVHDFGDRIDYIWNLASDTDTDRVFSTPEVVSRNNVNVMLSVLRFASVVRPKVLLHLSPSQMFGLQHWGSPPLKEGAPHQPADAYLASKCAQENLAYGYWRSGGGPLVLTQCGNLFGPGQTQGWIPEVIRALNSGDHIILPSDKTNNGYNQPAALDWLSAEDLAASWVWLTQTYDTILQSPRYEGHLTYMPDLPLEPHRFNITGQMATLWEIIETVADVMGKEADVSLLDCSPHRIHQNLDGSKLRDFGWSVSRPIVSRLIETVHWYQDNPWALERVEKRGEDQ